MIGKSAARAAVKPKKPPREPKHHSSKWERRERFQTFWFIVPSLIGVAFFYIAPFFRVIWYSVIDNTVSGELVGFENYARLLSNSVFRLAAKNTLVFSAIALPLAIILPLLLATLLMRRIPGKSIFRTILISPLMVPTASVILIFEVIFNYNGALNSFLANFGVSAVDWLRGDFSRYIVVLLYLWKNVGYNMILFMASLAAIPKDMIDAASIDGASALRTFFKIKLPYLSSSIVFVGLLSLINSFKVFREVYLLTGDYPNEKLYMLQHFMNNTYGSLDYQKLSAAAMIMCVVMVALISVLLRVDAKLGRDIEDG